MASSDEESGASETSPQQHKTDGQLKPSDLSNADAVRLLINYLDQKFTALKRKIADGTLHLLEQLSKKLKNEQQSTVKFIENQKQYQSNTETIGNVEQALSYLNSSNTYEAHSCLMKLKENTKQKYHFFRFCTKQG